MIYLKNMYSSYRLRKYIKSLILSKIQIIRITSYGYSELNLIYKKISMAMKFGGMVSKCFKEESDGWKFWINKVYG